MYSLITFFYIVLLIAYWKIALAILILFVCMLAVLYYIKANTPPEFPSSADAHTLATETANFLENGMLIADHHAYACGKGLAYIDGVFICAEVEDGEMCGPGQYPYGDPERKEFTDKGDFVTWLEEQLMSHPLHETTDICFTRVKSFVEAYRGSESIRHGQGKSA